MTEIGSWLRNWIGSDIPVYIIVRDWFCTCVVILEDGTIKVTLHA